MADVALVCGAGGALGSALVEAFLERGDTVVAADRSADARTDAARAEAVDLSSPDDVEALWERLAADGELPRWLVNAVGAFRGGTVAESEPTATASCTTSTSARPGGRAARPRGGCSRAARSSTSA